MRPRPSQPHAIPATPASMMEPLEERRMLTVFLNPKLRTLFVEGTNKSDRIVIQRDSEVSGRIAVNVNGVVTVRDFEQFRRVQVSGGKGNDSIIVDDAYGQFPVRRTVEIYGDSGNDTLTGNMNPDHIEGGGDDDLIDGRVGNDTIVGNEGDDTIFGSNGADRIVAGAGDDVVEGGKGADTIFGDEGFDTLSGNLGNDQIRGGASRDKIYGNEDDDDLFGDGGDDRILDGPGNDLITP